MELREEDGQLLDCIEDVYRCLEGALQQINRVRSVHITKLETWAEDLRSQRRIFEDISLPARLIAEHLIKLQYKAGQVALETEHLSLTLCNVGAVKVEEFGIIKIRLGKLEISWRDSDYNYYFYPDKVELRAVDEKSAIKLFFSLAFSRLTIVKFPELLKTSNVTYIHPQIEQWLK
ncbi:MAG: hypothetical protein WA131_01440 [Desulfitobacteriaceae bacterium]